MFLELRGAREYGAVTTNDHAPTIEDEFILTTHLIDVGDGTSRRFRTLSDHRGALIESAAVER
jgi:hypothetical protein